MKREADNIKWSFRLVNPDGILKSILILALSAIIVITSAKGYEQYKKRTAQAIVLKYASENALIYGADDSAPPLRFVDNDGQYKGVVIDYINQIAIEMGINIECRPYKWSDALSNIKEGKTDLIDLFENAERSQYMVFSKPLYTLRTIIVSLKGNTYSVSNIDNLTIATQKGDYANWFLETNYKNAKLVYVHDVGEGLDLLEQEKVDAVIGDEPVLQYYASKKNIKDKISAINTVLYEKPVVIGITKDKAELIEPINMAIDVINKSGQPEKIQQKWFGISTPLKDIPVSREENMQYFIVALLIIAGAVLFKLIENSALRRQVRKRTIELEKSRNELNLMLSEMPEGILVINNKGMIKTLNNQAAKLVNVEAAELKTMHIEKYINLLDTDDNDRILKTLSGKASDSFLQVNKGSKIYEFHILNISQGNKLQEDIMMTIEDVTLNVARNNQLLQSSKMIAVGQLAAGMAHQLRNPLSIIRTHSYLLSTNLSIDYQGKRSLHYIDESIKRAGSVIDNVMNFWRISDTDLSEIRLNEFIQSIIELNADDINKKAIRVELKCNGDLILYSSEESLKHVLMNILQNAIEAVENDSGVIIISAEEHAGNIIQIDCEDNGCGIPKENLQDLFNPFFTTKPPGKGTGLGLYITFSEVEKLQGNVTVESSLGEGTAFHIRIPNWENKEAAFEK